MNNEKPTLARKLFYLMIWVILAIVAIAVISAVIMRLPGLIEVFK